MPPFPGHPLALSRSESQTRLCLAIASQEQLSGHIRPIAHAQHHTYAAKARWIEGRRCTCVPESGRSAALMGANERMGMRKGETAKSEREVDAKAPTGWPGWGGWTDGSRGPSGSR